MRKRFLIALLFFMVCQLHALEGVLLPSLAVNVQDQKTHVLPARPILLPPVSEITAGQSATLFLVFQDRTSVERDVIGTLKKIDPSGKETTIAENISFLQEKTPGKGILTAGVHITLKTERSDPPGEYRFSLALLDRKSGENCRTECRLKILSETFASAPMTKEEWMVFLTGYYKKPRPERLPAALDYFFDHEMEMRRKAGKRYEPRAILYGLARAFSLNPQLWPNMAMRWVELAGKEKRFMFALIVSGMGDEAVRTISSQIGGKDGAILRAVHKKKFFSLETINAPWQLDCLWMEFFITGNFSPVERLCRELRQREVMTADQVREKTKKQETLTPEERRKFTDFLLTGAVEFSCINNIRHGNPLIAYYMEDMLLKKQCADETAAARMTEILKQASRKKTETSSAAEPAVTNRK